MSYRPDDWHTKIKMNPVIFSRLPSFEASILNRGFEAGADAMLEALRKQGQQVCVADPPYSLDITVNLAPAKQGHIVFIPDDKAIKGV